MIIIFNMGFDFRLGKNSFYTKAKNLSTYKNFELILLNYRCFRKYLILFQM